MSFDSRETGIATGQPVRLYKYQRGALKWLYTSADRDITYQGELYRSIAISDDGIRQAGDASADALKVIAPATMEIARQYRIVAPSREVTLTIIDTHYGEELGRVRYVGSVTGVTWPSLEKCEIQHATFSASMEKTGLRMGYSMGCPYSVYDHNCKVNAPAFKLTATISVVGVNFITVPALAGFDDHYFSGGFIEWNIGDGELERRGIDTHTGTTALLLALTEGLSAGTEIALYPGCNFTATVCDSKFDNIDNYGGIIHLPGVSPFDGNPIF